MQIIIARPAPTYLQVNSTDMSKHVYILQSKDIEKLDGWIFI